jgi:hypothetical protein
MKEVGHHVQPGLVIYIKKYLKAKEELWKLKYFNMQKLYNLLKETKIFQDVITLTNLKFQHTLAKISSFKNAHIKRDPLLVT